MCIISLSVLGGAIATAVGTTTATAAAGSAFAAIGTATAASVGATVTGTAATIAGVGVTVAADLAIAGALAGGIMGTIGAVQSAQEQQAQAEFMQQQEEENARLARREAENIEVMSRQEESQLRQKMLAQQASARTGYASSGVVLGAGSVLDYEADIADAYDLDSRNLEYDIESRKWQKKVEAANAADQAAMYRRQAKAAGQQKTTSLLSGVFTTVGNTASAALSAVGTLGKAGLLSTGSPKGAISGSPSSFGIDYRPNPKIAATA